MEMFENEWKSSANFGAVTDYRWQVAMHIVGHCALIAAQERGEDSAGRQALKLMASKDVAERALSIADYLVAGGLERGWFKPATVTEEQRAQYFGLLKNLELYPRFSDRDSQQTEKLMADIVALQSSSAPID